MYAIISTENNQVKFTSLDDYLSANGISIFQLDADDNLSVEEHLAQIKEQTSLDLINFKDVWHGNFVTMSAGEYRISLDQVLSDFSNYGYHEDFFCETFSTIYFFIKDRKIITVLSEKFTVSPKLEFLESLCISYAWIVKSDLDVVLGSKL